jgi:hypothetical protein
MITPEAAEAWKEWDDLFKRCAGLCGRRERDNIWIGVMLRRAEHRYPGCLKHFRSRPAWASLIRKQVKPFDHPGPEWLEGSLDDFLRAGNNRMGSENPWLISHRSTPFRTREKDLIPISIAEYAIGRMRDLEFDIAFARESVLKQQRRERELFIQQYGLALARLDISDL